MKNMYLILSVLFLFTGCSEEETKQQENSIYNQWNLIKYEQGLSPTENFTESQIIWNFQQQGKLKIEIDNSVSFSPIKSAGEYEFSLSGNRISIDNVEYDYSISKNTLIISDDPSSDGFKATFSKAIEGSKEETKQQENSIYNQWNLIKYEPGLSPTENFTESQIIWNFQQQGKLKIEIDNSVSFSPIKSAGEYEFSLSGNRISIDNVEYDYSISKNTLIISDDPSSDGFKATFSKAIEE